MLKRIEIRNFKRIQDNPDGTEKPMILNDLSQVNYFVGKNGSGKSSIFDFFRKIFSKLIELKGIDHVNSNSAETVILSTDEYFTQHSEGEIIISNIKYRKEKYVVEYLKDKGQDPKIVVRGSRPDNFNKSFKFNIPKPLVFELDSDFSYDLKYPNFFGNLHSRIVKIVGHYHSLSKQVFKEGVLDLVRFYQKSGLIKSSDYNAFFKADPNDKKAFEQDMPMLPSQLGCVDPFIIDLFKIDVLENEINYIMRASGINLINFIYISISELIKSDNEATDLFTICFEEPENKLHPNFQKKLPHLFRELVNVGKKNDKDIQFFISTHSNYLISAALEQNQELGEDLNSVYLLEDGQNTQSDGGPIDFSHFDNALSNLGVQPSDLLFANGVIWVEGPSDAIYVEKWLEMYAKSTNQKIYKPGLDFQFQMYGGALLKFYVDHEDQFNNSREEITNMFKINPHSFVILDFDNGISNFEQAKKIIEQEFISRSCKYWYDKVPVLNTIEDFTPLIIQESWWKGANNRHYDSWGESKPKTEYAWRCLKLWDAIEGELEDGKYIWDEYLEVISVQAKESLKSHIPDLYETIKSWNQN